MYSKCYKKYESSPLIQWMYRHTKKNLVSLAKISSFQRKSIPTNFLGFPKKKRKEKNQFLNYYYLNGSNIKLYCLVYILKSQGVELIDKQK